ncbi:MAG: SDR family oxidoreductase [Polyangiaceae bacterium]
MPKTILITGAGSGFGRLAAFDLAQRGHNVIAAVEIWPQVTALREEAKARKLTIQVDKMDVTSDSDRALVERWDLDVFINNAGIMEAGPIAELPLELLRSMFEVNFFSSVALAQRVAAKMVKKRAGRMIFLSSVAGLTTIPYSAGYCATKHAIESLAEGLRVELAPFGIRVATVNPGFYDTGFNDRGVDSVMHWYDPSKNFTRPEAFEVVAQHLSHQLPPQPIADLVVQVALAENPPFRNVLPIEIETFIKQSQLDAWAE